MSRICSRAASALLVGFCVSLSTGLAGAQPTAEQQSALRSNCRSDFMSHCSGVTPGGAEALQCLQRNVAKLSAGCQGAVNALNPRNGPQPQPASAPAPAPAPAASRPAAAVAAPAVSPPSPAAKTPAAPRTAKAPATTPALASAPPAAPMAAPSAEQLSAIKFTCRRDFMVSCRGVSPGGPEALACLQRNSARLSPDCRTSLAAVAEGEPAAAPAPAGASTAAPGRPVGPLRRAIRRRMEEP